MGKLVPHIPTGDWVALRRALNKLASIKLGPGASPTYTGLTLTDLTASALVGANASKLLESVTVGTGLDYTRPDLTLSHLGIESLTDPGGDRILFWDDVGTAACEWLTVGPSIAITVKNLDTIQDIRTSASPIFAGLHINSAEVTSTTLLTLESDISNNNEYNEILFKIAGGQNYGAIRSCVGVTAGDSYMSFFTTTDSGTLVRQVTIQHNGKVGLGTYNPETVLTIVNAAPYLTLYNITEEDTDGGGESRLIYKREDGAGTGTACFQFEASHDGSGANDQLGKGVWSVNTGAGLVQALEIGSDLLATFAGAITATNYTAVNLLTACATNAGAIDFSAANKTLTVEDNAVVSQDYSSDASPQFTGIELDHASDTTITRVSAGVIAIEGVTVMLVGSAPTAHSIASHNDTTGTGAELNTLTGGGDVGALHSHAAAYQPLDAELTSLAALSYVAASFVKMTGANTFVLRTLQETSDDLEATIDHDNLLNFAANEHYLQSAITEVGTIATGVWEGTDVAVLHGGTGASDAATAATNLGLGTGDIPTFIGAILNAGTLQINERATDPAEPSEGEVVIWLSDGTGYGDDGDVCIAGQAGSVTKKAILFDHSAGDAW